MPVKPRYGLERRHAPPVAGVDEAGRGPLAGPVVAAAVIITRRSSLPSGIRDSKQLTREVRERLYPAIFACSHVGVGAASVDEIDALNILHASMLAMKRAVDALPVSPLMALVDGNRPPPLSCGVTCVVEGDMRCLSIAAASIVAKVTRDRLMCELAEHWPLYGFERHMGYATRAHREALVRHGPTPHHRKSFMPVRDSQLTFDAAWAYAGEETVDYAD
ncbi:MAG: ribonuclease HII [Alphaproteobacteria bacterium]|nr:ribonuclease HII [Alphaproteobacteria bacterium]